MQVVACSSRSAALRRRGAKRAESTRPLKQALQARAGLGNRARPEPATNSLRLASAGPTVPMLGAL
eukprot:scaffold18592_cov42-Phaeocystis_antarctica.AAC.3